MLQRIILTVVAFCIILPAVAQNPEERPDMNREMTLEREYDPFVQDAAKVNTLPVVQEMKVQKRPVVYSDYTFSLFPDKQLQILPDGTTPVEVSHTIRNGYLNLSGGMLMSFAADFGYHLVNTDRTKFGLWFSHHSANGNVSVEQSDTTVKRKAVVNDNIGGLDLVHRFDKSALRLGGKFGYSSFNYYGTPTNIMSVSSLPLDEKFDYDSKQGDRLLNFYASLTSADKTALGYHFGADYTNFNQKYSLSAFNNGMNENHFRFDLGVSSAENDGKSFGVDVTANVLTYTAPETDLVGIPDSAFNTHFNGTLTPYLLLEMETCRLRLGVNFSIVSQNGDVKPLISPDVSLLLPFAGFSAFYADLRGGVESNSMASLSRVNRYINTAFTADASRTWADLTAGIRTCPTAGLWFDVFGGYKYTEADVFFNPSQFNYEDNMFGNFSLAYQPTSQRFNVGAEVKYEYRHDFDVYLKGIYYSYTLKAPTKPSWKYTYGSQIPTTSDELSIPYGKPTFTLNAGVNVHPLKPLTLSLDYAALSGIHAYIDNKDFKMKTVNDLRFKAAWQFKEQFSLYAQFNNLLFQRQQLYYGYPVYPFTAMAGLCLSF